MKKILVLLAVLSACSLFAQKLVSDPCNLKLNAKKIAPLGWYVQAAKVEHANVFYNELGENKRTIKFAPKKEQILFYCGTPIKAVKGDVIVLTVKAKGKGPFSIGYISYGEKGSNNFSYFEPWHIYVITSCETFENLYGRPADKKKKLYNGMLPCTLYQFFKPYERKPYQKNFSKGGFEKKDFGSNQRKDFGTNQKRDFVGQKREFESNYKKDFDYNRSHNNFKKKDNKNFGDK